MKINFFLMVTGFAVLLCEFTSLASAGTTEAISVDSAGNTGNNSSNEPSISADGRYVAFRSYADNLVPGDTNNQSDIFIRDRRTRATKIISKNVNGFLGNNHSAAPSISADGRYVAFQSLAGNLVPGDTNAISNVFVHDVQTGETIVVSKDPAGTFGNDGSAKPAMSADGRHVAFQSSASNLVPGDVNDKSDIFVLDRTTGKTSVISKNSAGEQSNGHSYDPAISADGRYVAFRSGASNLARGDTNDQEDIFLHDRKTDKTIILGRNVAGELGNNHSAAPSISADGRYIAFQSLAGNLVPGDKNDKADIFVYDQRTGKTKLISKNRTGGPGNKHSHDPAISADGRYVAFESSADDLVPNDSNGKEDAFVHDRNTGKTKLVSISSDGTQGDGGGCFLPSISADGCSIAFESESGNLVQNDNNAKTDVFVHDIH